MDVREVEKVAKYRFGPKSMRCLKTCHADLQRIAFELIKEMDVTVICGHRNERDQNEAYKNGYSWVKFPESKHNKMPSLAMDICPYDNGIDWNNIEAFRKMCLKVEEIAKRLGIRIRLGRDFKRRSRITGEIEPLPDWPHVELIDSGN